MKEFCLVKTVFTLSNIYFILSLASEAISIQANFDQYLDNEFKNAAVETDLSAVPHLKKN